MKQEKNDIVRDFKKWHGVHGRSIMDIHEWLRIYVEEHYQPKMNNDEIDKKIRKVFWQYKLNPDNFDELIYSILKAIEYREQKPKEKVFHSMQEFVDEYQPNSKLEIRVVPKDGSEPEENIFDKEGDKNGRN